MIEPSAPVLIPNDTIVIEANQGVFWDDATVEMGYWQAALDDGIHVLSISNIESDQADGIYTINDLDPDYTYYVDYTTFDTISFIDGEVIITLYAEDSVLIEGQLIGDDYNLYVINLLYWEPKPLNDVMLQNDGAMIDDGLVSEGLLGIYATDEKTYSLILALFTDNIEGDWTEEDIYGPYSMISDGYNGWLIYSLELSVKQNEDGSYTATGWILCYNNTMYHLDFQIPASSEGIENVLTGEKAAKFIQNGQLIIRKNGVHYNAAGQKLR